MVTPDILHKVGVLYVNDCIQINDEMSPNETDFLEFMASGVSLLYGIAFNDYTNEVTLNASNDTLSVSTCIQPFNFKHKGLNAWYAEINEVNLNIEELKALWKKFAYYNPFKYNNNGLFSYTKDLDKQILNRELIASIMKDLMAREEFKKLFILDNIELRHYL